MYPFWDDVILPIVTAARPRRVLEIGALRGETTVRMLERLGPDVELHVIDPVPEFDPSEHERKFAGRYIFHRDLSHNVLPDLPAVDIALVDGDHNWYTVYHELKMLDADARRDHALLPLLIMHDVLWPYGRRDLYYAPDNIPAEFRQPYAQRGMRPGVEGLLPTGGLNPMHYNAVTEGGPRNGVMTALDDFLAEFDRPVRRIVLPIYFGLAIVVEDARLREQPELARVLDWLESGEGNDTLLKIGEATRLSAMIFQHNEFYGRREHVVRSAGRYLDLLGAALLNEHYLDHELRLAYLAECIKEGRPPQRPKLGDAKREMQLKWEPLVEQRRSGAMPGAGFAGSSLPYTDMGRPRLDQLRACLDIVRENAVEGDLVECGTGRGGGAMFMRGYLEAHEIAGKRVWVVDSFRVRDHPDEPVQAYADLDNVRDGFARFGLFDDRVRFLQGDPSDVLASEPIKRIALLRIGNGAAADLSATLEALYRCVVYGGLVVIDNAENPERKRVIDEFRARRGITGPIDRVGWAAVSWLKTKPAAQAGLDSPAPAPRATAAAPATPTVTKDLSVVVVFYNMRREAARTLHSLSRAYQQGIDDLDYEVVVVENGSASDEVLGESFVQSFGPEFRYLDLGADATPTPVDALNKGLGVASGNTIAFMIDGAHVLTPGVLRYGMTGLQAYAPAIVVTQQWYIGPGQQPDAMQNGYDTAYEDNLFREISWPVDGYQLFDIGHFIGDRDWFDGLWESNCIFVPRKLLEQTGAFDERFTTPGGGYANLELYERLGGTPDVNVVTILGEGSFHQLHGGTTTNVVDPLDRRATITGYAEHFGELYGRRFRGPGRTLHYVGTMFPRAARTRARRMTGAAFGKVVTGEGPDGRPSQPKPIPDELKLEFIDSFWKTLAWRDTTWLGQRLTNAPTDLVAYQELITRGRPDWIIETGTANGGRAMFFASICELLGHGQVISIDVNISEKLPKHPRITYLEGKAQSDEVLRQVRKIVGPSPNALVVLGSQPASHIRIREEFEAYLEFCPKDSYVVIENTIYNGHPVWPGHGLGPAEATKSILAMHPEFAVDTTMEKYALTFNPGGYLKRIR